MYGIGTDGKQWPSTINAEEEMDIFGRKCLAARRLLERGVRFVQIWSGNDNGFPRRNWDSHEDVERDHGPLAQGFARGASALIRDLQQRGCSTTPSCFGPPSSVACPALKAAAKAAITIPTALRIGSAVAVSKEALHWRVDQWGYKPLDRANPTEVYDIHATILHLLGIDHTRLTYRNNGVDRRLTDVHGHVLKDILA